MHHHGRQDDRGNNDTTADHCDEWRNASSLGHPPCQPWQWLPEIDQPAPATSLATQADTEGARKLAKIRLKFYRFPEIAQGFAAVLSTKLDAALARMWLALFDLGSDGLVEHRLKFV